MHQHDRSDPDAEYEAFAARMRVIEDGPFTTNFEQLRRRGVTMPPPDAMDDATLSTKLWEVLRHLAALHVYYESTDHLNDRQLYTLMWTETLRADVPDLEPDPGESWHVDLVSTGSAENLQLYLRYYADERARAHWRRSYPNDTIPAHEALPFDRDRRLRELYDSDDDASSA